MSRKNSFIVQNKDFMNNYMIIYLNLVYNAIYYGSFY